MPSEFDAIASATEDASRHADVDDLLEELLVRLVEVVHADTAAVLLLDNAGEAVVARATYGIDEEVRQGVRVPLGVGFAGRIAAERRTVVLDRVDASTVSNPILWEKGIRRMLGVPLEAGPTLLGVLHVGRVGDRGFTEGDASRLELVAARIAAAVQAHELEVERAAGKIVQRSLLPDALPECPGLTFATRFVPAGIGGVGGDWYDAYVLPNRELWVMVGDVTGHGLGAALSMSRLRSALRAYSLDGHPPERVLALADRKLQFFDAGQMATVLALSLRPPYERATIALAGHLPPLLATSDGVTEFVAAPVSPPLGAGRGRPIVAATVELPLGSVLVAYTDGLVERRGEVIDEGLQRLRDAVTADAPETVCRRVMERLVGGVEPADDIALVAMGRVR